MRTIHSIVVSQHSFDIDSLKCAVFGNSSDLPVLTPQNNVTEERLSG